MVTIQFDKPIGPSPQNSMYGHLLQRKIFQLLRVDRGNWYPAFVGFVAFAASLTMTVPFAGPLVIAVLFRPKRWRQIVLASSLGSALGATALLMVFHHGAWVAFMHWHPHISGGASWHAMHQWLESYGTLSLFIVMALPVPDSPALLFFAVHQGNPLPVFLATFAGKFIKYSVYALLVKTFPEHFHFSTMRNWHDSVDEFSASRQGRNTLKKSPVAHERGDFVPKSLAKRP